MYATLKVTLSRVVDITGFVVPGSNSLVVLGHHYGAGVINGRIMAHVPGGEFQL